MKKEVLNYILLVSIHIVLGLVIYANTFFSKIYSLLILLLGFYFIIKTKNKNNEVLLAAAYVVGSEVFLRMTDGNPLHEFSKYSVIIFMLMGMVYSGFSKNAVPYWIFLLLLVPGIIIGATSLGINANVRKAIAFNISGSLCLGIAALYTFKRKITIQEVNNLLLVMGLPIISCATYLFLFTPKIKDVLTGTGSNGALSGGFGPNQVATVLGLGMFIFFTRVIFNSKEKILFILNLFLALYISYRGMLTFSRGGMITGFLMIIIYVFIIYINSKNTSKIKLNYIIGFVSAMMILIWSYTSYKTDGYIDKRYANQDASGRTKADRFTGRGEIANEELDMFLDNPFLGVGVAMGTQIRTEKRGMTDNFASHNELTRLLAEHGSLGIIALIILFFTPLFLYYDNKENIFLLCFLSFWLLTINHAAMRTASPSFIYALALLKIKFTNEEETIDIHRK